jgi:hypothetical protein
MRFVLALVAVALVGCGSVGPGPSAVGTPLSEPQLKFAVIDAAGKPAYCDPDFYPIARAGGEEKNAVDSYPTIRADASAYAAIVAHEQLPGGELSDAQKLVVYRAWKVLRAVPLSQSGNEYSFQYRTAHTTAGSAQYQMVSGTVRVDGAVNVASRINTGAPNCPICLAATTMIATPAGQVRVTDVRVGMTVWTQSAEGARVAASVVEVGSMEVPATHLMVHVVLADSRELLVSPGHKTADGRPAGTLKSGDELDGSEIVLWELVPYSAGRTYDLLPAGPTGFYWADGILLSSTMSSVPGG